MSIVGDVLDALNKLPFFKELATLPKRVRALEEKLNMAGAIAVDDRPVCPFCRTGRVNLIDEKPDPTFGDLGVKEQTLKCENPDCGKERKQQFDPNARR